MPDERKTPVLPRMSNAALAAAEAVAAFAPTLRQRAAECPGRVGGDWYDPDVFVNCMAMDANVANFCAATSPGRVLQLARSWQELYDGLADMLVENENLRRGRTRDNEELGRVEEALVALGYRVGEGIPAWAKRCHIGEAPPAGKTDPWKSLISRDEALAKLEDAKERIDIETKRSLALEDAVEKLRDECNRLRKELEARKAVETEEDADRFLVKLMALNIAPVSADLACLRQELESRMLRRKLAEVEKGTVSR